MTLVIRKRGLINQNTSKSKIKALLGLWCRAGTRTNEDTEDILK